MTEQPVPRTGPDATPAQYPAPDQPPYAAPDQTGYRTGYQAPDPSQPFPGGRGPTPMTPADETTWSTVTHLSWLAGSVVALPFLAPLVLFLVLRERGPFVRHHTAESLNFQLSVLLYGIALGIVGGILTLVTFGVLAPVLAVALGALAVFGIVFTVLAAIAASRGQWYRYPLTIRFVG